MTSTSCDVTVLGAGPAGLAAALVAARAGHSVVVLERAPGPGGMAASLEVGGMKVDHGSHRLHPSIEPRILAELRRLLGNDLQSRIRNGRIRMAGRWIAFPLRATDMVRNLPPAFAAAAVRDSFLGPLRRPATDTFHEVVRARLGPTVADHFYAPYVEKLWGIPATELSGELARRRVSATSPIAVVRRILRARSEVGRTFLYPRQGFGQICEALADAAVQAGVDLRVGAAVTDLEVGDGSVLVRTDDAEVESARAWSTLPATALVSMARPAPPAAVLDAARALRHRALLLVYLVLDQGRFSPYDAHYFPERELPVARLSEPKNYRANPDDPRDRTVLCAEVPCWEGDERWSAGNDELGDLVVDSLARSGLPAPAPVDVAVRRLPRVYPIYRPGTAAQLEAVEGWLGERPRLLTFGRQGLFVPDNTHHALAMGWAAGESLRADGSFDRDSWEQARGSFRGHVVED